MFMYIEERLRKKERERERVGGLCEDGLGD
jgi:hypothetical protein